MPYYVLKDAIETKKQVTCTYKGLIRKICPHVIGMAADGTPMCLSFQFGGQSSSGLPPGGEWRCMRVEEISDANSHAGPWHTGTGHSRPQTCVRIIDAEVSF